jgi:hypothetical protein
MLAIWIKDDGCRSGKGLKLATHAFTYLECYRLQTALQSMGLKVSLHKTGVLNQYNIYIHSGSIDKLESIVSPFIHPSKKYKLYIK